MRAEWMRSTRCALLVALAFSWSARSSAQTDQFGRCDGKISNCIVTMPGWNYAVRLYSPRAEIS